MSRCRFYETARTNNLIEQPSKKSKTSNFRELLHKALKPLRRFI